MLRVDRKFCPATPDGGVWGAGNCVCLLSMLGRRLVYVGCVESGLSLRCDSKCMLYVVCSMVNGQCYTATATVTDSEYIS